MCGLVLRLKPRVEPRNVLQALQLNSQKSMHVHRRFVDELGDDDELFEADAASGMCCALHLLAACLWRHGIGRVEHQRETFMSRSVSRKRTMRVVCPFCVCRVANVFWQRARGRAGRHQQGCAIALYLQVTAGVQGRCPHRIRGAPHHLRRLHGEAVAPMWPALCGRLACPA